MKRLVRFLVALCGIGLASCGGGGGATATATVTNLDSDVAKWVGTPCGVTSTYTVLPDDLNVTLAAFPFPSTSNTVNEAVLVNSVDIVYSPANTISPPLPSPAPMTLVGTRVEMGNSVTIAVRVAPQDFKGALPLRALRCSSIIYSYYVTMTFHCQYYKAGDTFDVSAQSNIRFADFVN